MFLLGLYHRCNWIFKNRIRNQYNEIIFAKGYLATGADLFKEAHSQGEVHQEVPELGKGF
jgi:hypothetical protein